MSGPPSTQRLREPSVGSSLQAESRRKALLRNLARPSWPPQGRQLLKSLAATMVPSLAIDAGASTQSQTPPAGQSPIVGTAGPTWGAPMSWNWLADSIDV